MLTREENVAMKQISNHPDEFSHPNLPCHRQGIQSPFVGKTRKTFSEKTVQQIAVCEVLNFEKKNNLHSILSLNS